MMMTSVRHRYLPADDTIAAAERGFGTRPARRF
jgi:hypothetical protein